jgi:hypothetical protein
MDLNWSVFGINPLKRDLQKGDRNGFWRRRE